MIRWSRFYRAHIKTDVPNLGVYLAKPTKDFGSTYLSFMFTPGSLAGDGS